MYSRTGPSLFSILWLIIGVLVARSHHYLHDLQTARQVASAALAIVLWPLLLLGISLHIHG